MMGQTMAVSGVLKRSMLALVLAALIAAASAGQASAKDLNFGGCQSFTAQSGTSLFSPDISTPSQQAAELNPRNDHDFKGACGR